MSVVTAQSDSHGERLTADGGLLYTEEVMRKIYTRENARLLL